MRFSLTLFFASLFWLLRVLAIPYELGWTFVLLQKMSLGFHKDCFESVSYFKEKICIYLIGLLQEKFIVSVQESRRPLSRWQQSQFSGRTLLLSWRWLPSHYVPHGLSSMYVYEKSELSLFWKTLILLDQDLTLLTSPLSMDCSGKNTGIDCHFLLQGIFFATPWIAARQASLSITKSRSSLKLSPIE